MENKLRGKAINYINANITSELTNREQIEVLEKAKHMILAYDIYGICEVLRKVLDKYVSSYCLSQYIPLFTYKNAVNYGGATGISSWYWWKVS